MKKVSIVVPVYNVEDYLDRCIESIVNQTYNNLEIILVDDASPDNCPAMCDEWAEKDSRIKVIHKLNNGVSAARNAGLDIVSGEYVTFVDSDDYIACDMIEKMMRRAEKDCTDAVVCGICDDYGDELKKESLVFEDRIYSKNEILENFIADVIRGEVCAKLIKSEIVRLVRFDENISFSEDLLFNYQIFKKCLSVSCMKEHFYFYYRKREGAATAQYLTDGVARSYKTTKVIAEEQENTALRDLAIWRHLRKVYVIIQKISKCGDKHFYNSYYDTIKNEIINYKAEIFSQSRYSLKQKFIALLLMISPKFAAEIMKNL